MASNSGWPKRHEVLSREATRILTTGTKSDWSKFNKLWIKERFRIKSKSYQPHDPDEDGRDTSSKTRHSDYSIAVTHADVSGRDLSNLEFDSITFEGCNFQNSDLLSASFESCSFKNSDFSLAKLIDSVFESCDLESVSFVKAALGGTKFHDVSACQCDFSDCRLDATDFLFSDLLDSAFSGADLSGARFHRVELGGSVMNRARMYDTVFVSTPLNAVKGLDEVTFEGPCAFDSHTLLAVKDVPVSFLRGAGLPERLIEYLPSLRDDPIQFFSCFISYSSQDDAFVRRLHADLQNVGIRTWFAPEDLKTGDRFRQRIDEADLPLDFRTV
ncbi:MAG: toll/interleukin-1 receptor domain-containing protein [Tagaea sp.]